MSPHAETTLRFLAAPTDAGQSGSVSAGRVLEWIDKAGYAAAARWSGGYTVTAYVGNVRFTRPVEVGDLVEARARVIVTGRTSMQVTVEVSSGPPTTAELAPATQCLMIFVSVGEDGRPRPVPALEPGTTEERLLAEWAGRRSLVRDEVVAAMEEVTYSDEGTAPRTMLRFLAPVTPEDHALDAHAVELVRIRERHGE